MIDTYFKQYFWSFQLIAIAIAGLLVARTANVFIADRLRGPPGGASETVATAQVARPNDKASVVAVQQFLERNVFRAEREDLTPPPPEEVAATEAAASGQLDTTRCERTTLRSNLVATIVSKDPGRSVAVFVDPAQNEPASYRTGEKLLDQAELVSIEWRRVLVNNGGRCEAFSIEDELPAEGASAPEAQLGMPPPPPMEPGSSQPPALDLGRSVRKVSETEYEIPKNEIDNVLGNLNVIATQARIVPSFRDGKANGFKLFSIRPGSLYSKIGIENGDVIQKINGYEMNSPDKALEIYGKLKDAQQITVDVVRRGRQVTLNYGIR